MRIVLGLLTLAILHLTAHSQAFGTSESIRWNFGNGTDGALPDAALTMDSSGNLYGTTAYGGAYGESILAGTVFELTPPSTSGGNWTESILWSFGNGTDGSHPVAGLIMDQGGNLYGTTFGGGAYGRGTVFKLTPPSTSGGSWTESILWSFGNGTDGAFPGGRPDHGYQRQSLRHDRTRRGSLERIRPGGTVFKLTPPSASGGNWTESILWSFGNGTDGAAPRPA